MPAFRILSLDGGGIRGAFAAGFLAEIEQTAQQPLGNYFDLLAGTSTGAIIAAGLAAGIPAVEIETFYTTWGRDIFRSRPDPPRHLAIPTAVAGWLAKWCQQEAGGPAWEYLFQTRHCPQVLRQALQHAFGARTLASLRGPRLLIPVVNLSLGKPVILRTPHLPMRHPERHWSLCEVLLAATAAPTYFPHRVLPDGLAYADGGIWATSPAWLAFAEAMRIRQWCQRPTCDPRYDTSEIEIVSLGCGISHFSLSPPGAAAGILYWSQRIADVMGNAQVEGLHDPLRFLLGSRYQRIDFVIPDAQWRLDNPEIAAALSQRGRDEARKWWPALRERFLRGATSPYQPFPDVGEMPEILETP